MKNNKTKFLLCFTNFFFGYFLLLNISLTLAFFNLLGEGEAPTEYRHDITYIPGFLYLFFFLGLFAVYISINVNLLKNEKNRNKKMLISLFFLIFGIMVRFLTL